MTLENGNRLNILWVAHRDPFSAKSGGAERTIFEVSRRLVRIGHSVTLLTVGRKGTKKNDTVERITVIRYTGNMRLHLILPIIIIKGNFDIVVNDLGHVIPWVSSVVLGRKNIAFFRHLHSRSLFGQVNWILAKILTGVEKTYPLLYRNTPFITESTTSIRDLNRLGIKNELIARIEPGVDMDEFFSGKKTEQPSIVYFGGMRKYKRPEECLYLAEFLLSRFPNLKFKIIGNGPVYGNLVEKALNRGLLNKVEFLGRVRTEELSQIVSQSWLNVHFSVTEGWGLSILEASACGTPTVAYRVPGVIDVIEDGINGIKIRDGDRELFAQSVLKILENPRPWWSSSIEVAKKYSWDSTVDKWKQLLMKIFEKEDD